MKLFVMRHPEPIGAAEICYGQSDLDVADDILAMTAAAIKPQLSGESIDMWISSPLQRCSKLAAALSVDHPRGFVTEQRLLEMSFGDWEGVRWDDIDREAFDTWAEDYINTAAPGGECLTDVALRVENLLAELREQNHETVVLVAHGGVIRVMLAHILGIPIQSTWNFTVGYGVLLEFNLGNEQWENTLVALTPLAI